jgi:hypothetical protein
MVEWGAWRAWGTWVAGSAWSAWSACVAELEVVERDAWSALAHR